MSKARDEVTVIVASYNPIYEKLARTIISVLLQENISLQIIVTDDGSENNCFELLEELFANYNFNNYHLLTSERNQGTIANVFKAREYVTGQYIKLISPGDYLYDGHTLDKWYKYVHDNDFKASFGDAIYYNYDNSDFKVISKYAQPQNPQLFSKDHYNRKQILLNYFLLKDLILGASLLVESDCMFEYLARLLGRITYAEDNMYRLMLADGVDIMYYDRPVVYYETGLGISNNGSSKWSCILEEEYHRVGKILVEEGSDKHCLKKIKRYLNYTEGRNNCKIIKYILFPQLIYWQLRKRLSTRYSRVDRDDSFMKEIHCRLLRAKN